MSVEQAVKMLEIARQKSPRDFLIFGLMAEPVPVTKRHGLPLLYAGSPYFSV